MLRVRLARLRRGAGVRVTMSSSLDHDDHDRAQIFTGLLDGIDDTR